ncbi:MAG: hypothetical protein UW70_C0021G0015 [Candidatus Peregrinibacteria bacterium GW2011_GWA2_44_7]|nr:MAG: hypothetical protein UW70_C0021G0015 [Candidatus Peregrinibacteria bacterium GW2011_GWA2_44_7]
MVQFHRMLKTIKEKEKETFVYTDPTLPLGLMGAGILILALAILGVVFEKWSSEVPLFAGVLFVLDSVLCFFLMKRQQILILDHPARTVEEHIQGQQRIFHWDEVEWADVERLRDEGILSSLNDTTVEFLENPEFPVTHIETNEKTRAIHLNYHLFLRLKQGKGKYFLFDNNGQGMKDYAEAALIAKTINTALELPKATLKALNLYTIKPSHRWAWALFFFVLLGGLASVYFLNRYGMI